MKIGSRREDDVRKRNETRKRIVVAKPLPPPRSRFNRISAEGRECPFTKESPKISEDEPHWSCDGRSSLGWKRSM